MINWIKKLLKIEDSPIEPLRELPQNEYGFNGRVVLNDVVKGYPIFLNFQRGKYKDFVKAFKDGVVPSNNICWITDEKMLTWISKDKEIYKLNFELLEKL